MAALLEGEWQALTASSVQTLRADGRRHCHPRREPGGIPADSSPSRLEDEPAHDQRQQDAREHADKMRLPATPTELCGAEPECEADAADVQQEAGVAAELAPRPTRLDQ